MEKVRKLSLAVALLFCLSGCQKTEKPVSHLVTSVEVTCYHNNEVLTRNYEKSQKISAVLYYLRTQVYRGKAEINPEGLPGDKFSIILRYSDGHCDKIFQRANRYISRNYHTWQEIEEKPASKLYPLLLAVPGDL